MYTNTNRKSQTYLPCKKKSTKCIKFPNVIIQEYFFCENACCRYSLAAPQQSTTNKYPQHVFIKNWRKSSLQLSSNTPSSSDISFARWYISKMHWVNDKQCRPWSGAVWSEFIQLAQACLNTVDSRYLEFQGTLWNTSRYPYFHISDLQNWEKSNSINHI